MHNLIPWWTSRMPVQPARCAVAAALAAFVLVACGGDNAPPPAPPPPPPPPPAPVAVWQAPQIAPVSSTSILLAQTDGADGVFVVGTTNNDGLVVQRFNASAGWFGNTVELRGLKDLQAVALDDGVALFGRDDTSWYRRDYTVSGLKPLQTMFPVDYRNSARTDAVIEVFSRTHAGVILAMAFVQDADPSRGNRIQTREYRAGVWSALLQSALVLPGNAGASNPEIMVDVVRSKAGDVARVRYQTLSIISYVAYRAPGDAAFAAITPALCSGRFCVESGGYGPPSLEFDGTATVPVFRSALETDQWLAIRSAVPTSLWPVSVITKINTYFLPITRFLRTDGTPIWLAVGSSGALALWEGAAQMDWAADVAALASCQFRVCAAISSPDADHIATLQTPTAGTATLYVSDRGSARWAQSAAVDSSALQAGSLAATTLTIANFYAKGSTQIVVGHAQRRSSTGEALGWPFAFVKR